MRTSLLGLGFLLGLGLIACGSAILEKPARRQYNVCLLPSVREMRVSPEVVEDGWMDAILWALDRWKEVVPELSFHVLVSSEAAETELPCITSFVPFTFTEPEYKKADVGEYKKADVGESKDGFIRLARDPGMSPDGRRWVLLHELGHHIFDLGHSTDRTSIMFPLAQTPPPLSIADVQAARAAFLKRDGQGGQDLRGPT